MMKIAIIQFPGSNCESESIRAIRAAGMDAEEFLWNRNPQELASFDGYFIVGGFSYEDRSRAGIIASLDPILKYLRGENEKGKPILGICNGAQILVESGFVPGLPDYRPAMALATNKRIKDGRVMGTGYYNTWVHMKLVVPSESTAFTGTLPSDLIMKIPVAHGEGRFIIPPTLLEEMKTKNCTTFQYCDEEGRITDEFPINPNGSLYNLAGVSNPRGNCLALMPHPERTLEGQPLFESMREYVTKKDSVKIAEPLTYQPTISAPKTYQLPEDATELIVESVITDNAAMTVALTLDHLSIPVSITRKIHWEITLKNGTDKEECMKQVIESSELFNPRKERVMSSSRRQGSSPHDLTILIRYIDDIGGEEKTQILRERYQIEDVEKIRSGILWTITPHDPEDTTAIQKTLQTHIFQNQYSQECYTYGTH